jgi:hypothetical protein
VPAREDVLRGGLSDDHFAAQLDQIVRNPAGYAAYGDPTQFFAVTWPTAGLGATWLTSRCGTEENCQTGLAGSASPIEVRI